jgi:hypothetical protein
MIALIDRSVDFKAIRLLPAANLGRSPERSEARGTKCSGLSEKGATAFH